MARKEKRKSNKMRARTTHGWGSMKKHRGAGNRGGRGNAGSTKQRAQLYLGKGLNKKGFKNLNSSKKEFITINTLELNSLYERMLKSGKIKQSDNIINIDLNLLGIEKLLAKGTVDKKFNINVLIASKKAIEKIESVGGKVNLLSTKNTEEEEDNSQEEVSEK